MLCNKCGSKLKATEFSFCESCNEKQRADRDLRLYTAQETAEKEAADNQTLVIFAGVFLGLLVGALGVAMFFLSRGVGTVTLATAPTVTTSAATAAAQSPGLPANFPTRNIPPEELKAMQEHYASEFAKIAAAIEDANGSGKRTQADMRESFSHVGTADTGQALVQNNTPPRTFRKVEGSLMVAANGAPPRPQAIENMAPAILTDGRGVPYFRNGSHFGLRLFALKPAGIFAQAGLQNGDVVLTVNGKQQMTFEEFNQLWKSGDSLSIDLLRNGSIELTLQVNTSPQH